MIISTYFGDLLPPTWTVGTHLGCLFVLFLLLRHSLSSLAFWHKSPRLILYLLHLKSGKSHFFQGVWVSFNGK